MHGFFSLNLISDQTMRIMFYWWWKKGVPFNNIFIQLLYFNLGQIKNNICLPHSLSLIGWCSLYRYISIGREVCSVDGWIEGYGRVLRAYLLFQLLIVTLSMSIFSLYSIKQKQKKFADFIIFFLRIFKILQK